MPEVYVITFTGCVLGFEELFFLSGCPFGR